MLLLLLLLNEADDGGVDVVVVELLHEGEVVLVLQVLVALLL